MDNANHSVRSYFPQVLANGYVPLPNLDKRCILKGWPRVKVDVRQVGLWARQKRWPAIGLRVEPPLIVVDIDVLEAEIAAAIERLVPAGALRRIGQAPKAAYFLRFDGVPFHRMMTRSWAPDVTVPKPVWSKVEVFAGGGGAKQFGAFGPHKTDDKTGAVLSWYAWPDGRSPANTRLESLPTVSAEAVLGILREAERLFAAAGLVVDDFTKGGTHEIEWVFDLDAATRFHDADGVEYDLTALEAAAHAAKVTPGPRLRVTGSFTRDPHSNHSPRGLVGISHFGRVYVHDTKTGITHHPVDAELIDDIGTDDFSSILNMIGDNA